MSININLVTGAAGFIGQKVAELLLKRGDVIIGIDNINNYYDVRLKNYRLNLLLQYPNFKFYKIDIENISKLSNLFKNNKFNTIFHLAARAGVRHSVEDPWAYIRTNIEGTLNILECMKFNNTKKLVLASTSSLYAGLPMPFNEQLPVNTPISPYASSKKAAESLSYTYHFQYGIDVSILRYFTVFGPLGRPDMAPYRFVKWILEGKPIMLNGNGDQSRDFTYIDDIARGTILAEIPLGYEIINLGGGNEPIKIREFIHWIEQMTGRKALIENCPSFTADMDYTMADITKAKRMLNWVPLVSTLDGLGKMLKKPDEFKFDI